MFKYIMDTITNNVAQGIRSTTVEFISKACIIHNNLYDYSLVDYKRAREPVYIICEKHGTFSQRPNDHLNGYGCPTCGGSKRASNEEFDTKLVSAKRNVIRLGDYVNSHTHLLVKCTICNHEWTAMPTKLIGKKATGCPKCRTEKGLFGQYSEYNGITFRSILEKDCYIVMKEYSDITGIAFVTQRKYPQSTTNHTCDFYVPHFKLWIEVSGIKTQKYKNGIQQKLQWVTELNEKFIFLQTPQQMKEMLYGTVFVE